MSIKVLVVDDTAVSRRIVSAALSGLPGVEVVGTASNGKIALARLASLKPHLLTLDIEMPEMNGIEVLEALAAARAPIASIVLSALTRRGGDLTIRALELGAFDFITKPDVDSPDAAIAEIRARLAPMLRVFQRNKEIRAQSPAPSAVFAPAQFPTRTRSGPPIVLIGVSTGGPVALAELLPMFPSDFPAPVLVVQHMPPMFTEALASSLRPKCRLDVREAQDGEVALPGCVYIAPGGRHMKLSAGHKAEPLIKLTDDPPENNCRPAVDALFRSAALNLPGRALAAILTGMGRDGMAGLQLLKRGGCYSIAQDEATSVVFGMPRAVIEAGLADSILPLKEIAPALIRHMSCTLS